MSETETKPFTLEEFNSHPAPGSYGMWGDAESARSHRQSEILEYEDRMKEERKRKYEEYEKRESLKRIGQITYYDHDIRCKVTIYDQDFTDYDKAVKLYKQTSRNGETFSLVNTEEDDNPCSCISLFKASKTTRDLLVKRVKEIAETHDDKVNAYEIKMFCEAIDKVNNEKLEKQFDIIKSLDFKSDKITKEEKQQLFFLLFKLIN